MRQILILVWLLWCTQSLNAQSKLCIEPRNNNSQNSIVNIVWSLDDTGIYVSTMGTISIYDLDESNVPIAKHEVCSGRFPEISVSNSYYAIGSAFLPFVLVYDIKTHEIIFKIAVDSENIRSIDFNESEDMIVVSKSDYDAGGFFDFNRTIQLWSIDEAESITELIPSKRTDSLYLPFDTDAVFLTDDTIWITGIDQENAFALTQPIMLLWNWNNNDVVNIRIKPDTLIELIGTSSYIIIGLDQDANIELEVNDLQHSSDNKVFSFSDIPITNILTSRFSATLDSSFLAIENEHGGIWIVDLSKQMIVAYKEFSTFANTISFDHSGTRLALGYGDGTLKIWNIYEDTTTSVARVFVP